MTYVNKGVNRGTGAVTPLAAVWNHRPVEYYIGLGCPALTHTRIGDLLLHVLESLEEFDLIAHWEIVIYARLETFNISDDEVCLEWMSCTAARYGTESCVVIAADALDALCCPEEERELQGVHRLAGIDAAADAVVDQGDDIVVDVKLLKIHWQFDLLVGHLCLYKWRLWKAELLVALIWMISVAVEVGNFAALKNEFVINFHSF